MQIELKDTIEKLQKYQEKFNETKDNLNKFMAAKGIIIEANSLLAEFNCLTFKFEQGAITEFIDSSMTKTIEEIRFEKAEEAFTEYDLLADVFKWEYVEDKEWEHISSSDEFVKPFSVKNEENTSVKWKFVVEFEHFSIKIKAKTVYDQDGDIMNEEFGKCS